jgi:hypothetical protein
MRVEKASLIVCKFITSYKDARKTAEKKEEQRKKKANLQL